MSVIWSSSDLWRPLLSWPYVAGGWGDVRMYDLRTGKMVAAASSMWCAGWIEQTRLMVVRDADYKAFWLTPDNTLTSPLIPNDLTRGAVARGGAWASCVDGRVVWNSRVIDSHPNNLGIAVNGPWCAHSRNYGGEPEWQGWRWRVYRGGEFAYEVTPQIPALGVELCPDGELLYSDTGRVRSAHYGADEDVSATTNRQEYCPIDRGILWSVLGGEARHVLGGEEVSALRHGAAYLDACQDDAGRWVIAYCDSTGRCTVERPESGVSVTIPFAFRPDMTDPQPPEPPPTPEPPMDWLLEGLLRQFVAKFPVPQGTPGNAFEDECRAWVRTFAEQAAFSASLWYGTKSSSVGSPQSKDVIAYKEAGKLWGWDILTGAGTGSPSVDYTPSTQDLTGQWFIDVTPTDHLGGTTPPVPPPVPDTLEQRVARLERIVSHHRLTE